MTAAFAAGILVGASLGVAGCVAWAWRAMGEKP